MIRCSECEYSNYLAISHGYSCKHENCKEIKCFKGKTKPHYCPLAGGKKYLTHGNMCRNTENLYYDMIHYKYVKGL